MNQERYTQETPQGVRDARIGYDQEHQRRGELADEALRDGSWPVDFDSIIFIRRFINEFCGGDDNLAIQRFGLKSVEELHEKMEKKASDVASSFQMSKDELLEKFPGVYI